jgi:glycosyltransferase involved in cell wall biosynthesis
MSNNNPLVSIVTPSFNKGPFIEETLLSIRNQTYKNIEHIVVDGGSTDETLSILKKYSSDLIWFSEPDTGQSDAINKGWRMAKGDIIAFLNADDTYLPNAVEIAVNYFLEHPETGMIYGDGILSDENGTFLTNFTAGEFNLKNLVFCKDNILQPAVFLRKPVFETVGDVDVDLHLAMDLDYWIRTGLRFKVNYIHQPLAAAKIYQDAKSSAQMHKYVVEYERILEKIFSDPHVLPDIKMIEKDAYNFVYVKGGLDYLHATMVREGLGYLWRAFRMNTVRCIGNICIILGQYLNKKIRLPLSLFEQI